MYIDFFYDQKRYIQSSELSILKEYDLEGNLLNKYLETPKNLAEEINNIQMMQIHPEDYFDFKTVNNKIVICGLKDIALSCQNIIIPNQIDGVMVIGISNFAFKNEKKISNVIMPDTINGIGISCFSNTPNLINVHLSNNIKTIPDGCFGESGIRFINLDNIENIESNAFYRSKITNLNLKNCNKVGFRSFELCVNIKNVDLTNVDQLDGYAFCKCDNLEEIIFPKELKVMPSHICMFCTNLKKIKIPKDVMAIRKSAFYCCENLTDVIFPENLKIIDEFSFFGTNLTNINIPDNLERIKSNSFSTCENLRSLEINGNNVEIEKGAFVNCPNLYDIKLNSNVKYKNDSFDFDSRLRIKHIENKEGINIEIER